MRLQIERAVRATLSHLEILLLDAGDIETANTVRCILASPAQIAALHQTFASNLRRPRRDDAASSDRQVWFQSFSTQQGHRLEEDQVNKLTAITKNWAFPEERVNTLLSCALLWYSCPALFWNGNPPNGDIFRRCFEDLERIREIDPLRRKILLVILSERVQQEQKQMRTDGKRQRSRSKLVEADTRQVCRKRVLLPTSLRSIMRKTWPDIDVAKQKRVKKMISLYSRFGWKWQQISPVEMILSLPDSAAKSFERHSWSSVELEAVNEFMKTLPQFRIRSHLERAMRSLTSYYHNIPQKGNRLPVIEDTTSFSALESAFPPNCCSQTSSLASSASDFFDIGGRSNHSPNGLDRDARLQPSNRNRSQLSPGDEQTTPAFSTTTAASCIQDEEQLQHPHEGSPIYATTLSDIPAPSESRLCSDPRPSSCMLHRASNPAASEVRPETRTISETPLHSSLLYLPVPRPEDSSYNGSDPTALHPQFGSRHDQFSRGSQSHDLHSFNDTSFAMDRILQEASAFVHTPQCNDTSVAMQWFASEVEGMGGIRTICGNASAVQSSTREADIWGPNDTSAALLGIIPQDETNSMSSYFNDTSIAMSAFAPQISHEGHLPPANG